MLNTPSSNTLSFPDIESFLSRSTCSSSLTRLSLSGLSLSDKEAVRLLERLTLLEELSIRDSWPYQTTETPITNRFIKSLHAYRKSELRPSAKKPLIRNLHTLKLSPYATRNGKEVSFNPKAFVDTVLSRWVDPAAPYIALPNMSVVNLRLVELDFQIGPGDAEESESDSNTEVLEVPEPFWVYRLLLPLQKAGLNITVKKQQKTKRRVVKNVLQMVASEEFDSEEEDEGEDEGSI
ncbi:hypothetical protein BT96DRAFT_998214 [Gymnopus androsaceus JB14]|uniref:Uncharacterized protein n=1 Tax=Gymnopus androsaceus JB14 TaxID=1447944 RepID=A0A6A4H9S1_9AGAR|nr:hypothetical protein BT96DRAFT_998214 [Gymnopus androsaceus JB14]